MIRIVGLAALGLLVFLLIPVQSETQSDDLKLYGYATMTLRDTEGNNIFLQIVHNQLVDQGETLILNQTFNDADADITTNNQQIGSICITSNMSSVNETDTAISFNSTNVLGGAYNCIFDTAVDISTTQGTAVVAPVAFAADGINVLNGETIRGIGICTAGAGTNMTDCHASPDTAAASAASHKPREAR